MDVIIDILTETIGLKESTAEVTVVAGALLISFYLLRLVGMLIGAQVNSTKQVQISVLVRFGVPPSGGAMYDPLKREL